MKSSLFIIFLTVASLVTTSFSVGADYNDNRQKTGGKPLKIMVISDLNSSYGSVTYSAEVDAVMNEMAQIKPDIIVCAGDMVAGQKASLTEENIQAMWQHFKEKILIPVSTSGIPFGFTVGNHDASPSYKTDRRLANKFWKDHVALTNLTFVDSTHFPFYFSYVKDQVFFMSWDAAASKVNSEVFDWIKRQSAGTAFRKARLRILMGHLPLYPIVDSKNKPGEVIAAADSTLSFFRDQGIDLYISGHQHAFFPASKGGVRLLNAGAIGDGPRKIIGDSRPAQKTYTIIEVPIKRSKKFTYRTYSPISNQLVDAKMLPDSVIGFNGILEKEKH